MDSHRLATIAAQQHGVVSIGQLTGLGFTTSMIKRRIESGALHRVHACVYAVGFVPAHFEAQCMSATLACGTFGCSAAVCRAAAAYLHGGWRGRAPEVAVVMERHNRTPFVPFVTHVTRSLPESDVEFIRGIPTTSRTRTIVDLAFDVGPTRLAFVIREIEYHARGEWHVADLERAVDGSPPQVRNTLRAALAIIDSGGGGTFSGLEQRALDHIVRAGLPIPTTNLAITVDGHAFVLDLAWDEYMVACEVDGPAHRRRGAARRDSIRDDALRAAGWTVARWPLDRIHSDADALVRDLASTLETHGWHLTPSRPGTGITQATQPGRLSRPTRAVPAQGSHRRLNRDGSER